MKRAILLLLFFLQGCTLQEDCALVDFFVPEEHFAREHPHKGPLMEFDEFWKSFETPAFSKLYHFALAKNHDIEIAKEKFRELLYDYGMNEAEVLKKINGSEDSLKIRELPPGRRSVEDPELKTIKKSPRSPSDVLEHEAYTLSLFKARFQIDLLGEHKSYLNSAKAKITSFEALLHDVILETRVTLAQKYYTYLIHKVRLKKAEELKASHEELKGRLQKRVEVGASSHEDGKKADEMSRNLNSMVQEIEDDLERTLLSISTITGESNLSKLEKALKDDFSALPTISAEILAGKPIDVIQKRADLKVKLELAKHFCELIGLGLAEEFPKLFLSASLETSAKKIQNLLSLKNFNYAIAYSLGQNLYQRWKAKAKLLKYRSQMKQAKKEYEKAVHYALSEVSHRILDFSKDRKKFASNEEYFLKMRDHLENIKERSDCDGKHLIDLIKGSFDHGVAEDKKYLSDIEKHLSALELVRSLGG